MKILQTSANGHFRSSSFLFLLFMLPDFRRASAGADSTAGAAPARFAFPLFHPLQPSPEPPRRQTRLNTRGHSPAGADNSIVRNELDLNSSSLSGPCLSSMLAQFDLHLEAWLGHSLANFFFAHLSYDVWKSGNPHRPIQVRDPTKADNLE